MASVAPPKTAPKTTAGRHRKPDRTEANVRGAVTVGQAVAPKRTKGSTTKKAAAGAASGAATGATVGSIIPGLGTAAGAGAGAVLGGAAGAAEGHKEKRAARSGGNRALIAEFVVCMIVLGLSPLSKPDGALAPAAWMKRATAICGVFIVLGLASSVGPRTARTAAGFGGLVCLALLIDQRSIFGVVATSFKAAGNAQVLQEGPPPADSSGQPPGWGQDVYQI